MNGKWLWILIAGLWAVPAAAQRPDYPTDYFSNPLGGSWNTVLLAGNFGECRPGHFHSGLDIKTGGVENKPVRAAAAGYISRISLQPGGFGHALYITHPNGYTTLYAHLNDFAKPIQAWVRGRQYAAERWTLDETLPPGQFPVGKDEIIAWSGNTGGSTAPHLHFEIRNTATEHPLNPQLFGCTVKDLKAPVIYSLSLYNADRSVYAALPQTVQVIGANGRYRTKQDTIAVPFEGLGIGITTDDFMDGSENTLSFFEASVYVGEELWQTITLDDIGYDETRYLNAYADHRIKYNSGRWVQLLYRLPGNKLRGVYRGETGPIRLSSGPLAIRIVLRDNNGNESTVQTVVGGTLTEPAADCASATDLTTPAVRVRIPAEALYDAVCFGEPRSRPDSAALSGRTTVGDPAVPLHSAVTIRLKADKAIPFAQRNKVALIRRDARGEEGRAAVSEAGGWYSADVRSFGEFRLLADEIPPLIKAMLPAAKWKKEIRFTVRDLRTGVRSFRGELDGRWILFEQHGSSWFYKMDARCPPGRHILTVTAIDELGNAATERFTFVR